MTIAYLDTISGISGDMTLGAFISAGLPFDLLREEISKLHLPGVELQAHHVVRHGITAVHVDVIISGEHHPEHESAHHHDHNHEQGHSHDHHHGESEHHAHHSHKHAHRSLGEIFAIIENSSLSQQVKENAKKIFLEVAKAESKVHNTPMEKVHLHEVGATDSIVDIVGAAICFERMGIEKVYSSPVKLGSGGFVKASHGMIPLPAPATIEILKEYPTILTDIPHELTTPTGAAIIKGMSAGTLSLERMTIKAIGYGAGTREVENLPNVLRVMIGELHPAYGLDELVLVETNIDDMNPEIYPYIIEKLLSAGAHDAYLIPVIMKKGRPGVLLSALTSRGKMEEITSIIFRETTTLGVRVIPTERKKVHREQKQIKTQFGLIFIKSVVRDGREQLIPEFEECKRISIEKGLPLLQVYKIIEKEASGNGL